MTSTLISVCFFAHFIIKRFFKKQKVTPKTSQTKTITEPETSNYRSEVHTTMQLDFYHVSVDLSNIVSINFKTMDFTNAFSSYKT